MTLGLRRHGDRGVMTHCLLDPIQPHDGSFTENYLATALSSAAKQKSSFSLMRSATSNRNTVM